MCVWTTSCRFCVVSGAAQPSQLYSDIFPTASLLSFMVFRCYSLLFLWAFFCIFRFSCFFLYRSLLNYSLLCVGCVHASVYCARIKWSHRNFAVKCRKKRISSARALPFDSERTHPVSKAKRHKKELLCRKLVDCDADAVVPFPLCGDWNSFHWTLPMLLKQLCTFRMCKCAGLQVWLAICIGKPGCGRLLKSSWQKPARGNICLSRTLPTVRPYFTVGVSWYYILVQMEAQQTVLLSLHGRKWNRISDRTKSTFRTAYESWEALAAFG